MPSLANKLLELYSQLAGLTLIGLILGRILPPVVPAYLGKFLFWIGVPLSIVAFLRRTELSGSIWIAPVIAWVAVLLGAGLAWFWLKLHHGSLEFFNPQGDAPAVSPGTKGSFLLSAMVGNTGYLGYPVTLSLVGAKYFAWALFYDMPGTILGAYGLGVAIAARFGKGETRQWQLALTLMQNPTLWSFGFGLLFRNVPLPDTAERLLQTAAWSILALSLVLIGMRLSQLSSWRSVQQASVSVTIKMVLVPLVLGFVLSRLGVSGAPLLVMVLQMAMPPAFATLVISEAFELDRDLSVTALALGAITLLLTLPLWLWLFGT